MTMNFSPSDLDDIKTRAAAMIAETAIREAGGAAGLVVLPISAIAQMTGLSRHTIPLRMPVTEMSPGKHGVSLKNLKDYLASKTTHPS